MISTLQSPGHSSFLNIETSHKLALFGIILLFSFGKPEIRTTLECRSRLKRFRRYLFTLILAELRL